MAGMIQVSAISQRGEGGLRGVTLILILILILIVILA